MLDPEVARVFRRRMSAFRRANGYPIRMVAELMGKPARLVSRVEGGRRRVDEDFVSQFLASVPMTRQERKEFIESW